MDLRDAADLRPLFGKRSAFVWIRHDSIILSKRKGQIAPESRRFLPDFDPRPGPVLKQSFTTNAIVPSWRSLVASKPIKRVWKNLGRYFIVAQPTTFASFFLMIAWYDRSGSNLLRLLGDAAGAYIVFFVGAFWTVFAIPVAYGIDRLLRSRLSRRRTRVAIIVGCGMTGYLLVFQLAPLAIACMLGCAAYGAVFSMRDSIRA